VRIAHYVYELIVNGEVVYIGCSKNPERRKYAHKGRKALAAWPSINVITGFWSRDKALRLEKKLIMERKPPLNRAHTGRKAPPRMSDDAARKIWLGYPRLTNQQVMAKLPGWTFELAYMRFGARAKSR
jgi:predicted GIY-YIG superfamily endonuclease